MSPPASGFPAADFPAAPPAAPLHIGTVSAWQEAVLRERRLLLRATQRRRADERAAAKHAADGGER